MNLPYSEQLTLIDQTQARLAKMRLYVSPAKPCNDNQSWDNLDGVADNRNACLQLIDKVGSFWKIRHASLLAVANRSPDMSGFTNKEIP